MVFRFLLTALALASSAGAVKAHEFWIDPVEFRVAPGEPVVANIRVGEDFEGPSYSYLPSNFRRFDIAQGAEVTAVKSRLGDRPPVKQTVDEGLTVLLHVTRDYRLTYKEFDKFKSFVTHKDAAWTLDRHVSRGFPRSDFGEAYSRYAKALVGVGAAAGIDRRYGLEVEIVAGLNPYVDSVQHGMPVTVYYRGKPRDTAQIEVFEKAPDGQVTSFTMPTDAVGRAVVPVKPGHRYLLDSVVLRAPSDALKDEKDVIWESLWASLTFEVPES